MSNKSEGQGEREGPSEDKTPPGTAIKNKDGSAGHWIVSEHGAARDPLVKDDRSEFGAVFGADLNGKETDDDGSNEIITHVTRSP